jgi:hypothetical protein
MCSTERVNDKVPAAYVIVRVSQHERYAASGLRYQM